MSIALVFVEVVEVVEVLLLHTFVNYIPQHTTLKHLCTPTQSSSLPVLFC